MEHVAKTLQHPDGKRRVLIVERSYGSFGYEVEELTYVYDGERRERCSDMYWSRLGQYPLALCDSPETAEREARGRVEWLKEVL